MSGLMESIQEKINSLHPKEQEVARFILEHPARVVQMGITDLAEKVQTSPSTISRFCRTFHLQGYAALKVKLSAELAQQSSVVPAYQDIVAGNSLDKIVAAIEANHLRSISDTSLMMDINELDRALTALRTARQIDIYGVATSGIVALDFHQKLIRIGKRSTAYTDPHLQITSASTLNQSDVAFGISYSGETPEIIEAATCAKEQGACVISLTKYGPNTLSDLSDVKLFTSTLEEGMRRGDMASRIAQLHVIDILFTGLVSSDFVNDVTKLEHSYQMVKKYRKEKGR